MVSNKSWQALCCVVNLGVFFGGIRDEMKALRERMAKAASSAANTVRGVRPKKELLGASVGIDLEFSAGRVRISKVLHSSPAALSGCIAVGDVIISIDAKEVSLGTSEDDLRAALSGDDGAPVWLEIGTAPGAAAKMVVLLRQPPLEPEPEQCVGELGFHAEYHPCGCLVSGFVEGGAAWLATQTCANTAVPDAAPPAENPSSVAEGSPGSPGGGQPLQFGGGSRC